MASSGKKKTTMAKLTRESKLRERRLDKQLKKDARKHASTHPPDGTGEDLNETTDESVNETTDESAPPAPGQPALETVAPALTDA